MNCNGILVVDDDPSIREILADILKLEGYRVSQAENGQDALDCLRKFEGDDFPGLVLLDIMMPVMNGIDFLEEFKKTPKFQSTPVVVMSANSSFRERAVKMFSVEQIKKPLDINDLLGLVRRRCSNDGS